MTGEPLLAVRDLEVAFTTDEGVVEAVGGVSLDLAAGEAVAIVGESGCGKSVTAQTVLGLTRSPNVRFAGSIAFRGAELLSASEDELRSVRGAEIAMVFQDPMTSLNPVQRIGDQIVEQLREHTELDRGAAGKRAVELLRLVDIPHAEERARCYPHEFSGGMRQRAMLAMALSCAPSVLIADEPTTALDVTIQAQIMELIKSVRRTSGAAVILITHDLGLVADIAERVLVMYAGQIVEAGTVDEIFYNPHHPYTWGLLASLARIDRPAKARLRSIPGQPPSLVNPPEGCRFRPRCVHAFARCEEQPALLQRLADRPGHPDRCWLSPEEKRRLRGDDRRDDDVG